MSRIQRWLAVMVVNCLVLLGVPASAWSSPSGGVSTAIAAAAKRFDVPAPLLTAICYLEGRFGDHGGTPSVDGGYGCMHLVHNDHGDSLDRAARLLGMPVARVRSDLAVNIAGGAAVLRDEARRLGLTPRGLADWYAPLAGYSQARTRSVAVDYADVVYQLLATGVSARAQTGEMIRLSPVHVRPNRSVTAQLPALAALPAGCTSDTNVDYPGAINCIVPTSYDCNTFSPCTYAGANRPNDLPIKFVTVHDIEGTATDAINVFWDRNSQVSMQYIVDSDGTVYQTLREKDIPYQAGNYWYNERAVGIEHTGYDATGYQWYNATEYLGSAKLVAYLLTKYGIPLDHDHVMSHGTTPSPTLGSSPNHVDPGPYWLWSYYLGLINQQGVPFPTGTGPAGVITLKPASDQQPLGPGGTETQDNFNFFYLYTGPSTAYGKVPRKGSATDITDVTDNVEPAISYYTLQHVTDPAGSGYEMYQVWYGEMTSTSSYSATGTLAWLAVPPGAAVPGRGSVVTLGAAKNKAATVYGRPTASRTYAIGSSPSGSQYVSPYTTVESGVLWYCINFNHRQVWVPASSVTAVQTG
ncbi:N-acetylmuramoyl-L-alanine amidase [Micromonospora sp. NPDC003776]